MKIKGLLVVLGLILATGSGVAGELHVLPVVADNVPGRNNSLWDTEVRIFTMAPPGEDMEVRRVWVALEGGGFEDDPETAPVWRLSDEAYHPDYMYDAVTVETRRVIVLNGASLLEGTGARVGAVALEIDVPVLVVARITDVEGEETQNIRGNQRHFQLLGLGQVVRGEIESMSGPSVLPWLTPDVGSQWGWDQCPPGQTCNWRNNLGLVNPSPQPLVVTLEMMAYCGVPYLDMPYVGDVSLCNPDEDNSICPGVAGEVFPDFVTSGHDEYEIELPPWGWIQVNNVDYQFTKPFPGAFIPTINFASSILALNIIPQSDDRPYYAYLSQVFSGVHDRNDPAFMTPIPGRFRSIYDNPAKTDSGAAASSEKE